MSPEHAEMCTLDVDTRGDIYSLGVLLYELLTSWTPFDQQKLVRSGLEEMRRTLREEEPPRPFDFDVRHRIGRCRRLSSCRNSKAP